MEHNSVVPLYAQLVEQLRRDIASNRFGKTGQIPTEAALSKKYDVSRITVRRAIEELARQGLVEKKQGKGTFVKSPRYSRNIGSGPMSFSQMCETNGLKPGARVLEKGIVTPQSEEIKKLLGLEEGGSAVYIARLRTGNDEPIAYEESYYPMEYSDLLSLDLENDSTYRYLREVRGIELHSTFIRLSIIHSDPRMSKLLQIPKKQAILELKGCVVNQDGRPVHTSYQCGYGERFEFTVR